MLALEVTVPVACFRKGFAREYWETEDLPPPATCYGFLLSLVGERDRCRHIGVRICPALLPQAERSLAPRQDTKADGAAEASTPRWPERSAVLRTLWRVKKLPLGSPGNTRPDYQELLTGVRLAIWLDSSEEAGTNPTLEDRVVVALDHPERIDRFGGLSLGESTHLVDEVSRLHDGWQTRARAYLLNDRGRLSLPVWVDHVGSAGTRYVSGDLVPVGQLAPSPEQMPRIEPL
jgi:CRISPR-associated protein Cas5t